MRTDNKACAQNTQQWWILRLINGLNILYIILHLIFTFHCFTAAHWLSGTAAEWHIDQATNQMLPEGENLTDVRSPSRVEAEAAEICLTETIPQEVVTQPVDCLIHLLAANITHEMLVIIRLWSLSLLSIKIPALVTCWWERLIGDLCGEAGGPALRLETSLVLSICSLLLLLLRVGGKQPSTRRVTFQHSGLSNWFEEPGDVEKRLNVR